MIGSTILHYKVLARIGQGGMGEVWVAEDTKLGRKVALKTLPPDLAGDPDRRARFEREARAIAALNHPNIVTIHSVEEANGVAFLTMELVEGKTLGDVIPKNGLPLGRFFDLAIPLASALAAAHQKGITHRDLKPANVMVTGDGRVKVLDFGLAKLAEAAPGGAGEAMLTATHTAGITAEGKIVGTAAYMSPEQAEGKPVDARSDVFSFGIVMYEMATGQQPFKGDTAISTITSILRDNPVSIGELKPEMPRHLGRVVSRCLAKEPDRRYQAALDVRNELEGLRGEVDSGEIDAPTSRSAVRPLPPRSPSRKKLLPIAAGALALVAMAAAGVVLWPKLRGGASPSAVAEGSGDKSIAVLPFANMSENPQSDYFSDGLAEELLNVLAKVPGLRVAARTSSFHFKGTTATVEEIGRQLGVATILEGSVRRAGNRVRITTQLINAKDGFHLWSETYDRELNDIFAIQESIAREVVGALRIKLMGPEGGAAPAARKPTTNLEAYDAYLFGKQRMARRTSASLTEAAQSFQKAIDLDPNYALAYVGLADATRLLTEYGTLSVSDANAKVESLLNKAIQLDPRLGEAYASLGSLSMWKGDFAAAESAFQRAIELSPNYATAYHWYALSVTGAKKRTSLFEKALELDPLSTVVLGNLGYELLRSGRTDEAVERFRRAIEIDPGSTIGYAGLAEAYGDYLNQPEEAVRFHRKAIEADPGNLRLRVGLADRFKEVGRYDEALAECRTVIQKDPDFSAAYAAMSGIYAQQGRLDEAVRWQRTAVDKDPDAWIPKVMLFFGYLNLGDEAAAADIEQRLAAMRPELTTARLVSAQLHLFRGEMEAAENDARLLWEKSPDFGRATVWGFDMRAGRAAEARELYRPSNPELFEAADPRVGNANLEAAIRVAAAELKLGEKQHAETLLRKCEAFIGSRDDGTRRATYREQRVQIHALMGRKEEALKALRQAIDDGFRVHSKLFLLDPTIDSLRDDPRFIAMVKEISDDIDRMRRALAASGK